MAYGTFYAITDAAVDFTGYDYIHLNLKADKNNYQFVLKLTYEFDQTTYDAYFPFYIKKANTYEDVMIDISSITGNVLYTVLASYLHMSVNYPETGYEITCTVATGYEITCTVALVKAVKGPLEICGVTPSGETVIYVHPTAVTSLTYLPVKTKAIAGVQGEWVQGRVKTKGYLRAVGLIETHEFAGGPIGS